MARATTTTTGCATTRAPKRKCSITLRRKTGTPTRAGTHEAAAEKIYNEIVGRIKQDDASVPFRKRGYWYYGAFETGKEYPIHARKKESLDAAEQVLLDVNQMAAGRDFFQIGSYEISPDNKLIAWTDDAVGRRQYTLRIKNLETGVVFADAIENIEPGIAWAGD